MKKRWLILSIISLLGYVVCDKLEDEKVAHYNNPTIEIVIKKKIIKKDVDYWIKHYSKQYNLDWKMVKAMMIFESNLNPKARNPKSSSYGFGQAIYSTNKWIHKLLGYKDFNHYKTSPIRQIEISCKYLSILNKQYKGDKKKVLMAYNGFELGDLYWKKVYKIKNKL